MRSVPIGNKEEGTSFLAPHFSFACQYISSLSLRSSPFLSVCLRLSVLTDIYYNPLHRSFLRTKNYAKRTKRTSQFRGLSICFHPLQKSMAAQFLHGGKFIHFIRFESLVQLKTFCADEIPLDGCSLETACVTRI